MPEETRLALRVAEQKAQAARREAEALEAGAGLAPSAVPALAPDEARRRTLSLDARRQRLALNRADLLRLYLNWQGRHGATIKAKEEFLLAYRGGVWPEVLAALGPKISWKTLERWKLIQERAESVLALADKRGLAHRGRSMLTDAHREVLLGLAMDPKAPAISSVVREARAIFKGRGLPEPSEATLRRYLDAYMSQCFDDWTFMREGKKAWNDNCALAVQRDWTLVDVGEVVIADGHVLNFETINPATGKPCRMTLLLWLDGRSNYPVGWEVMATENTQCIASAFRRACIALGKIPKVAYLDNGKAFRSRFFQGSRDFRQAGLTGLFEDLGVQVVHAWPYHGQSKPVERFFRTLGELETWVPSYTGNCIAAKPPRMNRGETLHRQLYEAMGGRPLTLEETHRTLAFFFDKYADRPSRARHLKGRTPREVFEAGTGPGVDLARLDLLMLAKEVKTITKQGVSLRGEQYFHPHLTGRRHPALLRYDPQNQDFVLVYDLDGTFICEAERLGLNAMHPVAEHLGNESQKRSLREALSFKREQEKLASARALEMLEAVVMPETRRRLESVEVRAESAPDRREGEAAAPLRMDTKPAPQPVLMSEEERVRLEALQERVRKEMAAEPAYIPAKKLRTRTELERYEYLFNVSVRDGIPLADEDRAWVDYYEATQEFRKYFSGRFEQLRELYAHQASMRATAR
jgi:putative transposase